jgi:predicted MFS family arabinose efflux permease
MKSEYFLAGLFIILLIICLNPFNFFMPSSMVMMLLIGIVVVFGIFSAVIWKERPKDEREVILSQKAGRMAFLIGTGVLVVGISLQEYYHMEDPWLIYALIAMVLGKIVSHIYFQNK